MTQDILNFLTGGVFSTAKDLIVNILEYIITFGMNIVNIIVSPLINKLCAGIPIIDDLTNQLNTVFNYAAPYISYILDLTFLSHPILVYLVLSIIARVVLKSQSYIVKLVIQWYEKLIP